MAVDVRNWPGAPIRNIRRAFFVLIPAAIYMVLLDQEVVIRAFKEGGDVGLSPSPGGHAHQAQSRSGSVNDKLIRIFYNLYVKSRDDEVRVLKIFEEQLRLADPRLHDIANFSVYSIGHRLPGVPSREHYADGGEERTLHALWRHCRANIEERVVYLHSKGSFHPSDDNDRLRRFMSEGALSAECAGLPPDCNVCSSRMSPHPHPHSSGNMWLGRCDYVARLRDPYDLSEGRLPAEFAADDGCRGRGRYFMEGWIHSHPSARPCDLYPGREYVWAYENVPDGNFTKDLQRAPRFGFDAYVALLKKSFWYCREDKSMNTPEGYRENRRQDYGLLYDAAEAVGGVGWYLREFLDAPSYPAG